jgi:hypothetical protein
MRLRRPSREPHRTSRRANLVQRGSAPAGLDLPGHRRSGAPGLRGGGSADPERAGRGVDVDGRQPEQPLPGPCVTRTLCVRACGTTSTFGTSHPREVTNTDSVATTETHRLHATGRDRL